MKTKKITQFFTLFAGLMMFANFAIAQNMSRHIELTVQQGKWIKLNLEADAANTQIKVECGTYDTTLIVGTDWIGFKNYYAQASTMRVYGNINKFDCSSNGSKITGLNVSNNSGLTYLACDNNNLSSLDITNLTALETLYCYNNNLSSLDLTDLTALMFLNCFNNNLSFLNITNLTALESLSCFGNNLSACALDYLFHRLPIRPASNKGRIYIKDGTNGTNPGDSTCCDTIATNRNWKVLDYNGNINIVNTNYACIMANPLWVGGVEVTSANASNITGEGITGSVSYIHGTNTLTLNGATITKGKTDGDGEVAILSEIPLTINLIDENEILNSTYPKNYAGILINQSDIPLNITGDGSLNMDVKSSSSGYCLGIFASSNPVNLSCNSLKITSSHVGIASKELHITNGTLEVLGKKMTAINAETVSIYSNALLNEGDEAPGIEVPNLTLTKKYVYIRPNGTGLTSLTSQGIQVCGGKGVIEIQAPKPPKGGAVEFTAHIYNVSGMLVRTLPLQGTEGQVTVPAGIYIVRIGNAIEKVVVR